MSMNTRADTSFKIFSCKIATNSPFSGEFEVARDINYFALFAITDNSSSKGDKTAVFYFVSRNPHRYTDPTGKQTMPVPIPFPLIRPFTLPNIRPWIDLPPLFFGPKPPSIQYYTPDSGVDWHHAPNGPDMKDPNSNPLGPEWEKDPGSDKDKTGAHRYYTNKKTGERVRWDDDDKHWHRLNPDQSNNKEKPYLDPDGNPVKKQDEKGHIMPNPQKPSPMPDIMT